MKNEYQFFSESPEKKTLIKICFYIFTCSNILIEENSRKDQINYSMSNTKSTRMKKQIFQRKKIVFCSRSLPTYRCVCLYLFHLLYECIPLSGSMSLSHLQNKTIESNIINFYILELQCVPFSFYDRDTKDLAVDLARIMEHTVQIFFIFSSLH